MLAWHWLADLYLEENIPFVLGHALYREAIHGGVVLAAFSGQRLPLRPGRQGWQVA